MNAKWQFCVAYLLTICVGDSADVFSPNPANRDSIGGSPFLVTSSEAPSIRVQYVYGAADFVTTAPVLLINQISYATPSWSGRVPIDVTLPNIEIRMSTTPKNPDFLSRNFVENVGVDETAVYSGPLHFYETQAEYYDIHIPITPFAYNPAVGNLLIDIFNYTPLLSRRDPDWSVDVSSRFLDSASALGSSGANSSSGFASTIVVMTRFTYTPVPEPSTWAILMTGALGFGIAGLRRARRRRR